MSLAWNDCKRHKAIYMLIALLSLMKLYAWKRPLGVVSSKPLKIIINKCAGWILRAGSDSLTRLSSENNIHKKGIKNFFFKSIMAWRIAGSVLVLRKLSNFMGIKLNAGNQFFSIWNVKCSQWACGSSRVRQNKVYWKNCTAWLFSEIKLQYA